MGFALGILVGMAVVILGLALIAFLMREKESPVLDRCPQRQACEVDVERGFFGHGHRLQCAGCPKYDEMRQIAKIAYDSKLDPMARLGWTTVMEKLPQARAPELDSFDEGKAYRDLLNR